jgi:FtsZ-binding cell division protein ZapB
METSFDRLEEKVRRTVEVVRRLRKENAELAAKLQSSEQRPGVAAEAQKRLDALDRELRALKAERAEVKDRIAKLVEVLDNLE